MNLLRLIMILELAACVLACAGCGASGRTGGAREVRVEAEAPKPPKPGPGLLIVERDVAQTRVHFAPVINHEAMVVNTSGSPTTLAIESSFPAALHVVTPFYPSFGYESLLGEPMRVPWDIPVAKYDILEKPTTAKRGTQTVFSWSDVKVAPESAAVAQYDQYFGPLSQFYLPNGALRLLDLVATFTPTVQSKGSTTVLELRVLLHNQGSEAIENLNFDVFVPDTLLPMEGDGETPLLESPVASSEGGPTFDRQTVADGKERPATGTQFRFSRIKLIPGEKSQIVMRVQGTPRKVAEVSHPLMTVLGISQGKRIWPETVVTASPSLPASRYYYRQYNLIVPAPVFFRFGKAGVETATFRPPATAPKTDEGAGGRGAKVR